jgi:N-glycosylase/DNA lyase
VIKSRLAEFKRLYKTGSDEDVFHELCFCLFTPQSKAKSCWSAVCGLKQKKLLMAGTHKDIASNITGVRFHNNKSGYVVKARNLFTDTANGILNIKQRIDSFDNTFNLRDWLVKNITGFGYKEASHFLRNIGMGKKIAILDRHILRNLIRYNAIKKIPETITPKLYMQIEQQMLKFADKTGIPADELDLLFWCKQTGEVFK